MWRIIRKAVSQTTDSTIFKFQIMYCVKFISEQLVEIS